jgi:dethiobiotin synthetase
MESGVDPAVGPVDARALALACGTTLPQSPRWTFPSPVAPASALQRGEGGVPGGRLTVEAVLHVLAQAAARSPHLWVETAGGVLSPLFLDPADRLWTCADLTAAILDDARLQDRPARVVLVDADRLGCLTSMATAWESCRARGVAVDALVLNQVQGDPGLLHADHPGWLHRMTGLETLRVPRGGKVPLPWLAAWVGLSPPGPSAA